LSTTTVTSGGGRGDGGAPEQKKAARVVGIPVGDGRSDRTGVECDVASGRSPWSIPRHDAEHRLAVHVLKREIHEVCARIDRYRVRVRH
jgi:hypothetical protein